MTEDERSYFADESRLDRKNQLECAKIAADAAVRVAALQLMTARVQAGANCLPITDEERAAVGNVGYAGDTFTCPDCGSHNAWHNGGFVACNGGEYADACGWRQEGFPTDKTSESDTPSSESPTLTTSDADPHEFTCPDCGGHAYGAPNPVRGCGDTIYCSGKDRLCGWSGPWGEHVHTEAA